MVHDVADDVPPVTASGRGHSGDSGQPERLQDRPDSAASVTACGQRHLTRAGQPWSRAPEGQAEMGGHAGRETGPKDREATASPGAPAHWLLLRPGRLSLPHVFRWGR